MPLLRTQYKVEFLRRTRQCGPGRRADPLSQRHSFFQNTASEQPVKAILGNDIDGFAEQRFQFLDKSRGEPGTCSFSHLYKQVDIAVCRCFSAGHRAEDTHVSGSMTMRAAQ